MARPRRLIYPKIPHHAIQRGNNRQKIFLNEKDYENFLRKLQKALLKSQVGLSAYCLMPNHFHLLICPATKEAMVCCMKTLCQSYTQYFNRKYERSGKLWENRYKVHSVNPDREWVVARYIEKNPVSAGIVVKAESYLYSSARHHLLGESNQLMSRSLFDEKARKGYCEFFSQISRKELEAERVKMARYLKNQEPFGFSTTPGSDPEAGGQTPCL